MNTTIEKIDNELIFDIEHIFMNYLKLYNLNSKCLKDTDIKISQNINLNIKNSEIIANSNQFASNYFIELSKNDKMIDLTSPIISIYPNSEISLFLAILLKKHILEISNNLNSSSELFEKYKNNLLSIYQNVLPQQKISKLLENICACITVLIIIGFQGNWNNGIDQLISAAKQNEQNTENKLIAALILSNVDNIYTMLEEKIDSNSSKFILSMFDTYNVVINDFINFLIQKDFSGDKQNFVNTELFKAFIGIIRYPKYFKINIIKIHGFLGFLIECIYYININQDFNAQICELFDNAFSSSTNNVKYNFTNNFNINNFINFINEMPKNEDFQEIVKCIKLIQNMKIFYSNKDINEIKNNPKDIQILFASCNIFNSICENYGYIFVIPELDNIVQEIFDFFLGLPFLKINQLLFSSLSDLFLLSQERYEFQNYDINIRENKKQNLKQFLYKIQNTVLEIMKLPNDDLNSFNIEKNKELLSSSLGLDKYINEILKLNVSDDDKNNFIENSEEFYDYIFDIINNLLDGKDYCQKLYEFLKISIDKKDFSTIDSIMNIFNNLSFKIISYYPEIFFNTIDIIFQNKEVLLKNQRFTLQFLKLLYKNYIDISKNIKYLYIILNNLININIINCDKMIQIIIILINKLVLTSYQVYKLSIEDDNDKAFKSITDNDKSDLSNIFNLLSKFLLDNLQTANQFYLYKIIDTFYHSLFLNIRLNINSPDTIYTASEKLLEEANKIYINRNNDNIIKYICILWSIIKNVGRENKNALFNLLNKIDHSYNPSQSYFTNIQKNILEIINLNKNSFNKNIIDEIILLNITLILIIKDKTIEFFDYFNQIITLIISMNPKYIKIYNLTYNLYVQIFNYSPNSEKYKNISQIGFDILNSINNVYTTIQNQDEAISLANKQLEFLILYIQKSPHFINNFNKEIFIQSINNILNLFDNNNQVDISINFMNFFRIFFDLSKNNNVFQNLLKDVFLINIIKTIMKHIQYFNSYNYVRCAQNCFYIFKNCVGNELEKKFRIALNDFYNDNSSVEMIILYINFLKSKENINIPEKKIKEFISDLSELYYAMNKRKNEFLKKYKDIIENVNPEVKEGKMQKITINKNSTIYMDLFAK